LNGELIFPARRWIPVQEGDIVTYKPPGGGGYGNPHDRDPRAVLRDVETGFVSREAARMIYGVAISADGLIDEEETARLRAPG
jgi:N-methylhydantoinase B